MSELEKGVRAVIETVLNAVEVQHPEIRFIPGLIDGEALLSGEHYKDVETDVSRDIAAYARGGVNKGLRERYDELASKYNKLRAKYYLVARSAR